MATANVALVDMNKAREDVVNRYLAHYELPIKGSLPQKVENLSSFLRAKIPDAHLGECKTCGGLSDVREERCPFCGDGDVIDEAGKVVKTEPKVEIEKVQTNGHANGNGAAIVKLNPATRAAARSRTEAQKEAIVSERVESMVVSLAKELDESIFKIQRLMKATVVSYWELGRAIFENYSNDLYKQRKDDKGKQKYEHFSQFISAELKMSHTYALQLMDVSVNFTPEDVATLGISRLKLLVRLSEKEKQEMLERAKRDALSCSTIAQEVRRLVGGKRRASRDGTKRGGTGRKAKPKLPSAPKGGVTVALMLKRMKVQLFAKPKKGAKLARAHALADVPHGTLELDNGVEIFFVVGKDANDQLFLTVEPRRKA